MLEYLPSMHEVVGNSLTPLAMLQMGDDNSKTGGLGKEEEVYSEGQHRSLEQNVHSLF